MHRDIAELLASDIESNDLRKCARRWMRLKVQAEAARGPEREQLRREVEKAEIEMKQWRDLASLVRSLAADPEEILHYHVITGT